MALPGVAAAVGARRVVWLDAIVPAAAGVTTTAPQLRAHIAGLVRHGRIAAWPTWWAADELAAERVRARVGAEATELPGDFYDVAVPVPAWPTVDPRRQS